MQIIARIVQMYAPFKRRLLVSFLLLMCVEMLGIISPYLYGQMINAADTRQLNLIVWVAAGYLLALLTSRTVSWFREKLSLVLDLNTNLHVSMYTIGRVLNYSIGQHHNENSGIKQQVISQGEQAIQQAMSRTLFELAPMFLGAIVATVALLIYNLLIGLITAVGAAIYIGITTRAHKKFVVMIRDVRKKNRETGKVYGEIVRNVELVKLNAREHRAQAEYQQALMETNDLEKNTWLKVMRYWYTSGLITLSITVINTMVCSLLVFNGNITIGAMVTCMGWAGPVLMKVSSIGNIQRTVMNWHVDIERYFKMMDIPCDIAVLDNPVRPQKYFGQIAFEHVSFMYPHLSSTEDDGSQEKMPGESAQSAIVDLTVTLEKGKRYAIVGESGSGKSTIKHLILRSYDPQHGRILIDGVDLRTLDLRHYLEQVGIVDQEIMLFDRTLRENILWARDEALPRLTEEELLGICQQACIDKFFDRLREGLDTKIGERGVKLSGGERQRVGIARALAKTPSVLIFDEATSHLDAVNEADITASLESVSFGKTTIIIAHRLSTILSADQIMVMNKGRLVAMGTHRELYKDCPSYEALVGHQIRALEKIHFSLSDQTGTVVKLASRRT